MSLASSLYAIGDAIDPRLAYWSLTLTSGREWNERHLVTTFRKGQKGVRKLDWGDDIRTTGDIYKIKELRLHCPDGRVATLEMAEPGEMRARWPAFQFKTVSMDMVGAWGVPLEYHVIGRVIDKVSGACECFVWDYRPLPEQQYQPAQLFIPAQPATDEHPAIPEQPGLPEIPYRPAGEHLIAYRSNIYAFGMWRDTCTPLGALAVDVQGFRL